MSIERFVALITPLFAALAGLITTLVSQLVPGANLSKTDLTALFTLGAISGLSAALKWLHGRQHPAPPVLAGAMIEATPLLGQTSPPPPVTVNVHPAPGQAAAEINWALKTAAPPVTEPAAASVTTPPTPSAP